MKHTLLIISAICSLWCCSASLEAQNQIQSPNGKIRAEFVEGKGLVVSYNEGKFWQPILTLGTDKQWHSAPRKDKVKYNMAVGKRSQCTNSFNECLYQNPNNAKELLTVRVYDDGVTWSGCKEYELTLSEISNSWLQPYTDNYEDYYYPSKKFEAGKHYGYPALFEFEMGTFALMAESGIKADMTCSSLYSVDDAGKFQIKPAGEEKSGTQCVIIGKLADIVESTLVNDNAEPTVGNYSWVKPGIAAWTYWANNHGAKNYDIVKKYVDLAAVMRLPYIMIDAEWDEMGDGRSIEDAVRYAKDHGVDVMLWYNSSIGWVDGAPGPKDRLNTDANRAKEFAWLTALGVKGIKVDFFSGENNTNVKYMHELLESTAKNKIMCNFHGVTLPRGWQRTYPNLVTCEAVYGEEWYNNVPTFTDKAAAHNATLPFTRNVVGSMDYTPCAFSNSQNPHITTAAHELALTCLFESGILHLPDSPDSYLAQPQEILDLIRTMPTAWDDVVFLNGYPGESAIIARRKGANWYIAGINGTNTSTTLSFKIDRLKNLGKKITIYEDSGKAERPWCISSSKTVPTTFDCLANGGFIIVIEP